MGPALVSPRANLSSTVCAFSPSSSPINLSIHLSACAHSPAPPRQVTGGKWTTYRKMAEDVVDTLVNTGRLPPPARHCATQSLKLLGAHGYSGTTNAEVAQRSSDIAVAAAAAGGSAAPAPRYMVMPEQAKHLAAAYGDKAFDVLELVKWSNGALAAPLAAGLPYIEAEVVHCCRQVGGAWWAAGGFWYGCSRWRDGDLGECLWLVVHPHLPPSPFPSPTTFCPPPPLPPYTNRSTAPQ